MTSTGVTARTSDARVLVVTGASSGIGAALAAQAAAAGWRIVAVARRASQLSSVVDAITAAGGSAIAVVADVTAKDAPQHIVAAALQAFGRIDVVVNNAGSATPGSLLGQSDAQTDAQWQLHVAAPLRLARAAFPAVRQNGGGFVFLGSGLARVPAPMYGAYCAAKAAARAAAIQLRRELKPDGVYSMYVDPGVVDTGFSTASGMVPNEAWWHGKPHSVAARILRGIERRASRVNAVPWQTALTVFGEWFPAIADAAMASIVEGPASLPPAPPAPALAAQTTIAPEPVTIDAPHGGFESALEPVARRMERVKLSESFVRGLLVPGDEIELNEAAMRWAGMPNKNERAALKEVLDALTASGYLAAEDGDTWKVLRAPE